MDKPIRKPTRLKNYNYSKTGAYFITICTKNRMRILSHIVGCGACDAPFVRLTKYGKIAAKYIDLMDDKYDDVTVKEYIIMPDHIHLLIVINPKDCPGGSSQAPNPTNNVIPKFISLFKRYCNLEYEENIWQKSFYDHVIRNHDDYIECWRYIRDNPKRWVLKNEKKKEDCFK